MISIEKIQGENISTISSIQFKTDSGKTFDSLFNAILYQVLHDEPSFNPREFEHDIQLKSLTLHERQYASFIVWNDLSVEKGIVTLAHAFHIASLWKIPHSQAHSSLIGFYNFAMGAVRKAAPHGVSIYFSCDQAADVPSFEYGLSSSLSGQIEAQIKDLTEQNKVLVASINEAQWGTYASGMSGANMQEYSPLEVPPTPLDTNSGSEETVEKTEEVEKAKKETNNPMEEPAKKEEVVDLWHWEPNTDAITAIDACHRVCRGFPLQPRVITDTFMSSDKKTPLMQVMSGIEFCSADVSVSESLKMYEGMWLARGIDENADGSRYDTLQVVADTKEGRVVFQQYRVKL